MGGQFNPCALASMIFDSYNAAIEVSDREAAKRLLTNYYDHRDQCRKCGSE